MNSLIERAQHLLWIIARQDVEGLSAQRTEVLRQLGALEAQARRSGFSDLYEQVLRHQPGVTKIFL